MKLLGLLVAAALAFAPGLACATSMSLTGAGKPSAAAPAYTGPGDIVASAKAWYGFRAYSAAAATAQLQAVRLKRSSDNEKCDLKLATTGGLVSTVSNCSGASNGATATTWCANGAGSCSVDTRYDQSGNGNNAVAGAGGTFVFSCINSLPCEQVNGTNYLSTGISSTSQPLSVSAVAYHNSAATGQNDIISESNGIFFNSGGGNVGGYFGSSPAVAAADNAFHAMQFKVANASSVINVDGTESAVTFGANSLGSSVFLSAQSSTPTSPLNGYLVEVGIWPAAFTTGAGAQAALICHNQAAYYGITATC